MLDIDINVLLNININKHEINIERMFWNVQGEFWPNISIGISLTNTSFFIKIIPNPFF